MAFDFGGGANVITSAFVPPSLPLTMACYFNDATPLATTVLMSLGVDSARYQIQTDGSSHVLGRVVNGTTNPTSTSSLSYSGSQWYSAVAVFTSSASRVVYLNNTVGNVETTLAAVSPASELDIGARKASGVFGAGVVGKMANVGVWDAALSAADILEFFSGKPACRIKPQNLLFYAPLIRTAQDLVEGIALTVSGPTPSNTHFPQRGS